MFLVSCSPLTSSSSQDSSQNINEENKITISTTDYEKKYLEKIVAAYNNSVLEQDKITVTFSDGYEYLSGNVTSDLLFTNDVLFKQYSLWDIAYNIDDNLLVDENIKNLFTKDDVLYTYPISASTGSVLYYDSNYFSTNNLTLEFILKTCKQNNKKFHFDLENGWYILSLFLSPDFKGLNSISYTIQGNDVKYHMSYDDEEGASMMEYIHTLYKNYEEYFILTTGGLSNLDLFDANEIIASISLPIYSLFDSEYVDNHIVSSKLPSFEIDDKIYQMGSLGAYYGYLINKNSSNITTCKKFINFLLNEENQKIMVEDTGFVPLNDDAITDIDEIDNLLLGQIEQYQYMSIESICIESSVYNALNPIASAVVSGDLKGCSSWLEFLTNQFDLIR